MTPMLRDTARPATHPPLRGALTAMVTPFAADGSIDEDALRRLVRWQVLAGIDGIVPVGTTGEAPTLTPAERDRVIAITVETVSERASRGRVPVVAGTGTNDTAATVAATRRAADLGADAALVVAPYYNRPDGRMLDAHFRAVADDGDLPIVVYNVPSRTGTNVPVGRVPAARRAPPGHRRSRRRAATSSRSPGSAANGRVTSPSWPATTPGPCRSWRWAATASCRSRATRSRASWWRCARPRSPATGTARAGSTSAGCRCSSPISPVARIPFR